jgi:hypothetical protein
LKQTQKAKQSSKWQGTGKLASGDYIVSLSAEAPRIIFDSVTSPVMLIQDEEVLFINKKGWEKFGYCPDGTIGKKISFLIRKRVEKDSHDTALNGYTQALSGKSSSRIIISVIAENGESILVEPRAILIEYNHRPALLAFLLDPVEQKFHEGNWASLPRAINFAAGDLRNLLQSITNAEYYLRKQLLANEPYVKNSKDLRKMLKVIESAVKRSDQIVRELQNPLHRNSANANEWECSD